MSTPAKGDHLPWFEFVPAVFMSDVEGLPLQEVGIYIHLLCRYWVGQGNLHEPERLARIFATQTDDEGESLERVLSMFFPDGRHAAMDNLLKVAADKVATARENGRKGGRRSGQAALSQAPASGRGVGPSMQPGGDEVSEF